MSNSSDNLSVTLNLITFWINQIVPIIQISFGTFGNLSNIIVFTRGSLRSNPCSMYFLFTSIINLFEIYVVILLDYLSVSWNWNPADTSTIWCIISEYLRYPLLSLVVWFIVLSSCDRFLMSSRDAGTRKLSNLSLARKLIGFTILFFFLIFVHVLVFFRPVKIGTVTLCTVLSSPYIIFMNIVFVMVCNVLPIISMAIFGVLTALNVRKIRSRVAPLTGNARNERMRSNDRQLIRMLLFQVLITVLISIPFCCVSMYNTFARVLLGEQLSVTGTVIINFTANLLAKLYVTNSVIGFYIYTLSGPKFRFEFKRCTRYGLKITFIKTGLMGCLPLRIQQALLDDDNQPMDPHRRGNNLRTIHQQQQPIVVIINA